MLQRLIAAVLGVLGLVVGGLGIASATAWRADDVLVADARIASDDRIVVTDAGVLDLAGDPVTVRVTAAGDAPVVLAVGRDTDVTAWVGADPHVRVTGLSGWHELRTTAVEGEPAPSPTATPDPATVDPAAADPAAGGAAAETAAPTATVPDPRGSDLWVVEETGEGSATLTWQAQPGRWSLIAASLGDTPPVVQLSWPRTVTTPWLWPCVAVGALLLLAGIALAVRLWLRARRGADDWRPVATGPVPVVAGAGAGAGAVAAPVGAEAGETVVLTRRQLRDAGLTGETRSRRRERAGRAVTGEHATVAGDAPGRVARGTSPVPGTGEQTPADAPVPRWAAAAAAVPSSTTSPTRGSRRDAERAPWDERSASPAQPGAVEGSPTDGGVLVGRASGGAPGRASAPAPTARPSAPGDAAHRPAAPGAAGPHPAAPGATSGPAAAGPAPTGGPAAAGAPGETRRGPAWAAQLGRRAPGAPSAYQVGPSAPGQLPAGPDAPAARADGRTAGVPGHAASSTGPARTSSSTAPDGPAPGWTPSAPVRPAAGGPGTGTLPGAAGTRLPGPPGRLSHPDASPAPAGSRASWLPSGPAQPPGSAPQEAPRARAGAAGPLPAPTRGGPLTSPARSGPAGPEPRAGVGAAAHRVTQTPVGPADRTRPAQPHPGGHHAAPSDAPAARADAWRRAWGFPEPPEDEQEQGRTHGEGER